MSQRQTRITFERRLMAIHEVEFMVPKRPLQKCDIEFDVRADGDGLGTLKVSRGGVVWRPRNHKYGYYSTWEKFADTLERYHTSKRAL